MSESPLYLLNTQPDARLLAAWVARHHARHERQPSDLGDALHGLVRAAFGEEVIEHYHHAAQWEIAETDRVVTDFELQRGFERA